MQNSSSIVFSCIYEQKHYLEYTRNSVNNISRQEWLGVISGLCGGCSQLGDWACMVFAFHDPAVCSGPSLFFPSLPSFLPSFLPPSLPPSLTPSLPPSHSFLPSLSPSLLLMPSLYLESVVDVTGVISAAPEKITGCSQQDVEIQVTKVG